MLVRLLLVVTTLTLVSGCVLRGPEVRVKAPQVEVGAQGGHCPPGQAKKGNC